ncbi:MAG: nucleoside phosphorylase [Bacteroidaceae bacterium]|nr:nucleoside phosphorylase [Bacteroidaceae bacterium]
MKYAPSELIVNPDGSIFHLHIRPEHLADNVILVGDPGRVETVASYFDSKECDIISREFHTITGSYRGKRITVLSTGIGCDNIDIVMNELDALANINFDTREDNQFFRQLTIVRIGTCGAIQPEIPLGTFVASVKSIGFDGLLNYYADRDKVCDLELEQAFCQHMNWSAIKGAPYVAMADHTLIEQIASQDMVRGITVACGGFYGPQGRRIRMEIQDPNQNEKIESFRYQINIGGQDNILSICNFEMESSALAGLASILGHRAMTCCMVIANRHSKEMNTTYKNNIETLISMVLDRI